MTLVLARTEAASPAPGYVLRFQPLAHDGRALAFACDARGRIDLDCLSERSRAHYLYARALVGRDYAPPAVVSADAAVP